MLYRFFLIASCALLSACGGGDSAQPARSGPLVTVIETETHAFYDQIDAVGTAYAREQAVLSASVTERIVRLNYDDGQFVKAGQVIAVLAQGQEAAALAEASAREREAALQLARLKELKARGFATNASVDTQVALAAAARAQADLARATISDRVIRAPFDGYLSLRNLSVGAVVQAGAEIATIADLSQIKLDFPISETLLSSVSKGTAIVAESAAWPGVQFRGVIASIDPIIRPDTRAVMLRAYFPNPDKKLRPGMLMRVNIESAPRQNLGVPELAVVTESDRRFVFLVDKDNKLSRVPVETGVRQEGLVEIVSGLQAGDKIVGDGVVKVAHGMTIRTKDAALDESRN